MVSERQDVLFHHWLTRQRTALSPHDQWMLDHVQADVRTHAMARRAGVTDGAISQQYSRLVRILQKQLQL